jgi:hypothetical protein
LLWNSLKDLHKKLNIFKMYIFQENDTYSDRSQWEEHESVISLSKKFSVKIFMIEKISNLFLAEFCQKSESKLKKMVPICLKLHGTHFSEKIRPIGVKLINLFKF